MLRGLSVDRHSPPVSGRSTPKSHHSPQRDYMQKYHTVSNLFFSLFFFRLQMFLFHRLLLVFSKTKPVIYSINEFNQYSFFNY